jgi:cyclohexyl-isocyanide hydratase
MPLRIGMLLFPQLTQLDLAGPYEVFARLPDTKVELLWKTRDPVVSDTGMSILPTLTLAECPQLDVVFVPGGPGQLPLTEDESILEFLRAQAREAKYVTSVCTGSLVLAAAGLLSGHQATCHWMYRELLAELGVKVSSERYVIDRNRVTGAGVTAGIDFGLKLAALLRGESEARRIQLQIEYDPAPPFDAGSPQRAGPEIVNAVRGRAAGLLEARRVVVERIKRRLNAASPQSRSSHT